MKRRAVLKLIAATAAQMPFGALAQAKVPRLCFLTYDPGTAESPTARYKAFFERLAELGYVHPRTLLIGYIAAEGRTDQYPVLASECVAHTPDIIAVTTTPGARALKRATQTIPIVMVALGDPVGTGLVENLVHQGGNITGTTIMTSGLAAKRLELLKEAVPGISRVLVLAYLTDPISPLQVQALKEAAPRLSVTLLIQDVLSANDLAAAFEAGMREGAQALITTAESFFRAERTKVTDLAARHKLPAIYPYAVFVLDRGGLMAYEADASELHRGAAEYVDKILKGASPADLPVQQPVRLRLIVNLKTANALGLTMPATILARADEVVE